MGSIPPNADLSKIPLMPNPNGDPPNFENPPSLAHAPMIVGTVFATCTTIFVALRLVNNSTPPRTLSVDDYLCLIAHVLMIGYVGITASFEESFRHTWDIPLSEIDSTFVKKTFAENMIVGPSLWACKAAILLLYIRLFGSKRWLTWTSYITLFIIFGIYWSNIPLAGVNCTPRNGSGWDFTVLTRCKNLSVTGPIQGATGLAADVFILVLPLPVIRSLHVGSKKKIGLFVVFMAGSLAVITSAISMYYRTMIFTSPDTFWYSARIYICVYVECFITIMVSCAPSMSSFWINTITKSSFYASWVSRSFMSRSSSSQSRNRGKVSFGSKRSATKSSFGTSTLVKENPSPYELHSMGSDLDAASERRIITKAVDIEQQSERRWH